MLVLEIKGVKVSVATRNLNCDYPRGLSKSQHPNKIDTVQMLYGICILRAVVAAGPPRGSSSSIIRSKSRILYP